MSTVDELAARIRAAHAASSSVERAVECGRLLIESKPLVSRGRWLPWLAESCGMAVRTAQAHMRLARQWDAASDAVRNGWRISGVRVSLYGEPRRRRADGLQMVERHLKKLQQAVGKLEDPVQLEWVATRLRALSAELLMLT